MAAAPDPVTVHVHVHGAVTGSVPLRVADLLFADAELVIPEYASLTPLDLARGGVPGATGRGREAYRDAGVAGLLDLAERTHRVGYGAVEAVRVAESGLTRPKVVVEVRDGPPYAYRVHAPVDVAAMTDALSSLGDRRGFAVETRRSLGVDPGANVRRFLADR